LFQLKDFDAFFTKINIGSVRELHLQTRLLVDDFNTVGYKEETRKKKYLDCCELDSRYGWHRRQRQEVELIPTLQLPDLKNKTIVGW